MVEQPARASISWSNNEGYLQNFHQNRVLGQRLLRESKTNIRLLSEAFDCIHDVYNDVAPYSHNKKLDEAHDEIKGLISRYRVSDFRLRRLNFAAIYDKLDSLFADLTKEAVKTGFYPRKVKSRTMDDKVNALKF